MEIEQILTEFWIEWDRRELQGIALPFTQEQQNAIRVFAIWLHGKYSIIPREKG